MYVYLCVREVKSSVDLVQNVDWSRFEEKEGENERQRHQRPVHTITPQSSVGNFRTVSHDPMFSKGTTFPHKHSDDCRLFSTYRASGSVAQTANFCFSRSKISIL